MLRNVNLRIVLALACLLLSSIAFGQTPNIGSLNGLKYDSNHFILANLTQSGGTLSIINSWGYPLDSSGNLLIDCALNCAGGSMVYPAGSGIPIVVSGTSWGTTVAAPTGAVVGTSDTQTLTNKSIAASEVNSGTLAAAQMPALTGDCTTSAGAVATTCPKINGTAFAGTNGNVVSFGAANTPADSGVVAANVATAASNYVSGNLVQGAGANKTTSDSGIATANVVTAASAATAAKQLCTASGASKTCSYVDFPDVKSYPSANCVSTVAGSAWNTTLTPTCIAGTNNLGGQLPFVDASVAQFETEIPADWDTTSQPFVNLFFNSGTNTTGTVIFNVAVACTKSDGSITSDPAFNTADALATKTMAAATRTWSTSLQLTQVISGNNCVAGGTMLVKVTRATDTAASAVQVTKMTITTPRLLTVQAN